MSTWGSLPTANTNGEEEYVPPKVWKWENPDMESVNQPTAGSRYEKELPVGEHDIQLYSLATPNGQKVTIMLEELLECGYMDAEYDAWPIKIWNKEQFGSGFVNINPNSKIPAMIIRSTGMKIFESGNILLYLAERYDTKNIFFSSTTTNDDPMKRNEILNWLFWQVGSAPYLGGGFGHFFRYANVKYQYPIDRFTMEIKRQLDVLDKQLTTNTYITGEQYTIADIAIWPWYGILVLDMSYDNAYEFLNIKEEYPNVIRWSKLIYERPAVKRGRMVNRLFGPKDEQLHERHTANDFMNKTQDKLEEQQQQEEEEDNKN